LGSRADQIRAIQLKKKAQNVARNINLPFYGDSSTMFIPPPPDGPPPLPPPPPSHLMMNYNHLPPSHNLPSHLDQTMKYDHEMLSQNMMMVNQPPPPPIYDQPSHYQPSHDHDQYLSHNQPSHDQPSQNQQEEEEDFITPSHPSIPSHLRKKKRNRRNRRKNYEMMRQQNEMMGDDHSNFMIDHDPLGFEI